MCGCVLHACPYCSWKVGCLARWEKYRCALRAAPSRHGAAVTGRTRGRLLDELDAVRVWGGARAAVRRLVVPDEEAAEAGKPEPRLVRGRVRGGGAAAIAGQAATQAGGEGPVAVE